MSHSNPDIYEQVPPQAVPEEKAVLGAMLLDNQSIPRAVQYLTPSSFHDTRNRRIFEAACVLFDRSEPADQITVAEELKKLGQLEEVGGVYYLSDLAANTVTSANIEYHAKIVADRAQRRRLIVLGSQTQARARDLSEEPAQTRRQIEETLREEDRQSTVSHYVSGDGIRGRKTEALNKADTERTGIDKLDRIILGFERGEFVVIAGRTSTGKTALMMQIGLNLTARDVPVAVESYEMSVNQLLRRAVSLRGAVSYHELPEETTAYLDDVFESLAESPLSLSDSSLDLSAMLANVTMRVHNSGLRVLFVDYLQLVPTGTKFDSRQQEVAHISSSLKLFAKKTGITVVALSQFHRIAHAGEPSLSDLRDSGTIEQDADKIIFTHRTPKDEDAIIDGMNRRYQIELIVAKNRNGPTGKFWQRWEGSIMRIGELDQR